MNFFQRLRLARDSSITVANLLDELLARTGDREVSIDERGSHSLAEIHREVVAMDAFLRDRVGLRAGQLVAVYRTNDIQCFHWFLAIVRAGGIAVPLNPMLTAAEVRRILANSSAEILITDTATYTRSVQSRDNLDACVWIQCDHAADNLPGFLRFDLNASDSANAYPPTTIDSSATIAIFHTSGTSGFPKGAALSNRQLLGARMSSFLAGFVLGPRDLALVGLPWSHIMGVSIALYGLLAGVRGCFLERFDTSRALDMIERNRVTAVVGVPAMFAKLVNANPEPARLKSVRLWLSASDHLPSTVREKLRAYGAFLRMFGKRVPTVLINGYGMVELGGMAMVGIDLSFARGSGDLCIPVPPFQIRVADEAGSALRAGQTGECQIYRRGTQPRYWNDATRSEASEDALLTSDGWLRTGDLAVKNRLGLIRLVGRMKDVIKSGGYSVYVRELEEAIAAHPSVARAAAFGLPHEEKGEMPAAAAELHTGAAVTESELLDWCRQRLAAYKAPRQIWIFASGDLPQNATGKILRRELRERFSQTTQQP